jgi:transcriptional regulator with XRE-family HTH domain
MRASEDARRVRAEAMQPLFDLIDSRGLKRVWVAQKIGIDKRRLSRYEHGENRMPDEIFTQLCSLLNAPQSVQHLTKPQKHEAKLGQNRTSTQGP